MAEGDVQAAFASAGQKNSTGSHHRRRCNIAAADMDKAKREYDVTLSAIRACMEN